MRRTVSDYLRQGYDAFMAGDLALCSDSIVAILKQIPNEPNALLLAAMLAMDRGRRFESDGTTIDGHTLAQGWLERAMTVVDQANKPWPMAWNFKSTMLFRLGRFQDAIDAADKAIQLKPDVFEARINKANALNAMGRYHDALVMYAEAGKFQPGNPSVRFNRAFPTLSLGDWAKGFEYYEYRWAMPEWNRDHRREFHSQIPQWHAQPLTGKRLLLHWEQGFGDTLMCLRYLPWLLEKEPALLVVEVQKALARLARERITHDVLILAHGDPIPPVDYWVSMMSLMQRHGTTQENMPAPYFLRG